MYRIDVSGGTIADDGLRAEDGRSATLVAAGQQIGLTVDIEAPPDSGWSLQSETGHELTVRSPPPCGPGEDCIAGYLTLDTAGVDPGATADPRLPARSPTSRSTYASSPTPAAGRRRVASAPR